MDKEIEDSLNKTDMKDLDSFDIYLYSELCKAEEIREQNKKIIGKCSLLPISATFVTTLASIILGFNPLLFVGIVGLTAGGAGLIAIGNIKKINYNKLGISSKELKRMKKSGLLEEIKSKLEIYYENKRHEEFESLEETIKTINNKSTRNSFNKNIQTNEIVNDNTQELNM